MAKLVELLGSELIKKGGEKVSTETALAGKKGVALYFSAHWCPPCRGFTPKLAEWYTADLQAKGLEVVFLSSDRDDKSFNDYFAEMPWLAVPFENREVKDKLSKQFKIQGIPSLIILDGATGDLITKDGRNCVSADPKGEELPWHPKPLSELIGNEFVTKDGAKDWAAVGKGKTVGLYFSAHWCPPCRNFTPKFAEVYKKVKASANGSNFEVIFLSSDRDEASFTEYYNEMPWCTIPFADRKRKEQLSQHFEVRGIPSLVILDENLQVVNKSAVGAIRADEEGAKFPWAPELVPNVNQECDGIDEAPSVVVLENDADAATKDKNLAVLKAVAQKYAAEAKAKKEDQEFNFFFASESGDISERVASECSVSSWKDSNACHTGSKTCVVMMDIPDRGAYYKFEESEFSESTLQKFLDDYKAKKLTRCQMGEE